MDKVFKTCFVLIYTIGLLFLILLDIRWGKKDPIPKPGLREEGRTCVNLECILREKNVVLKSLDKSWEIISSKRLFPDWDRASSKK
ncbi:hypothetical protein LEP1GSC058_0760 [Leptospira fainei serovar Hurstbridge str. BUT 6]|uniref:Uncharacterized protein n=1 Tax=Leptospira fainei serovar Hurstbridge str. BUT 6 TaxID=1193011 RepID=S3VGV3_9LEPT|nr:hypothetical protein [Leptospira fainei]EPG75710.1 hypothetical protein LEP1GSC058_0760 [Leptospira fainei serovar Hurstbridge str. BUT 6]